MYYSDDQIQKDELDAACGMYGRAHKCIERSVGTNLSGKDHLENRSGGERIILKWILERVE
jgi:hypothetical protein